MPSGRASERDVGVRKPTSAVGGAVAWLLTHRTPDPEVGGSSSTLVAVLCLRPDMAEKLLTPGTLNFNTNKTLLESARLLIVFVDLIIPRMVVR